MDWVVNAASDFPIVVACSPPVPPGSTYAHSLLAAPAWLQKIDHHSLRNAGADPCGITHELVTFS